MIELWDFQQDLIEDIYSAWDSGAQNVCAVSATGTGKTVMFSHMLAEHNGPTVAIAHRQELVSQISLALARNGVVHKIIGQENTIKFCIRKQMIDLGRSYYDVNSHCAVAGVDTLIRLNPNNPWFKRVGLWVTDECHHLLADNKWGKAVSMFPNARGAGFTATPLRADGRGLGRHADGLIDVMVIGPEPRDIINRGFLADYRLFAPKSDVDTSNIKLSAGGDFSPEPLRDAVHKSHIIGDVVEHYLKIAPGKLGITFCVDIESATSQAQAFRQRGVPAEVLSSLSSDSHRYNILERFARGDIKQITNVDLFGEGFDCPAVEVVSKARPTMSFALDRQQSGRALRACTGKSHGIIIDHVDNVSRHGIPDKFMSWTLDNTRNKRKMMVEVISIRVCPDCSFVYERSEGLTCPSCGYYPEPGKRSSPALVDGSLQELTVEVLAQLRGAVEAVKNPPKIPYGATPEIIGAIKKRHKQKIETIEELKQHIFNWTVGGIDDPQQQRKFYLQFGVDVLTAQTLPTKEMQQLIERIRGTNQ